MGSSTGRAAEDGARDCFICRILYPQGRSESATSPQSWSALRMQRQRTKPLRGGPTSPSPMGIESPDPMPRETPGGVFGVTQRFARRCGNGAMLSTRVAVQGVATPPLEGGRSRTRV